MDEHVMTRVSPIKKTEELAIAAMRMFPTDTSLFVTE
jgi:hypothetical protein